MPRPLKRTRAWKCNGAQHMAFGPRGQAAVFFTVYATILAQPVIFHLTTAESLRQTLYAASISERCVAPIKTSA